MISVLMPVYNVEKYIEKTLESVQNQTYGDFELIMIDDGSTDRSPEICDNACENDKRLRVIHCPNGGVSAARNIALKEVKGDYIFFMDSDDLILPETFEELLNTLISTGADMVSANLFYTDNTGTPIDKLNMASPVKNETLTGEQYLEKLCMPNANFYCTSTNKLFKASLFDGITYPVGKINEDEARIHEVIFKCNKIVTVRKSYYNYIKHSQGITGTRFGLKNLDRDDAFMGRVIFLCEHGLYDLAVRTAVNALNDAVVTFANCVKFGYYYGKTKNRLRDIFKFEYSYASQYKNPTLHEKKVLLIAKVILMCPDFYAHYVEIQTKISNYGFGEAFKDELYEFIIKCFSVLPAKDRIIFESHPDLSCNTYPVYKYLLEQGLNEKYEFVWLCEDKNKYRDFGEKNVSFINFSKNAESFGEKLKYMYYISTAKALVYSNQLLGLHGKDKISVCLQHGMPLKSSNGTYCVKNNCTAALCESEFFADNYSSDFRVEKEKMLFAGFPRNDLFFSDNDSLEAFGFDKYSKVVFWLPTFRQRNDGSKNKQVNSFEMNVRGSGIPAIETAEDMIRVNEYLKSNNCLLVLKPHPVQDMSVVSDIGLSNFFIINDADLAEKGVQLYELLGKCDAMITDYSSVYYDYLLTDKPIGLTVGDIGEYIEKRGFVYKKPLDILKGEYIYDTDGLIKFLDNVKCGNDIAKQERTAVKNMIHTVKDGTSAQRVGEYIIDKLENRI